jgi:hypothetical protein
MYYFPNLTKPLNKSVGLRTWPSIPYIEITITYVVLKGTIICTFFYLTVMIFMFLIVNLFRFSGTAGLTSFAYILNSFGNAWLYYLCNYLICTNQVFNIHWINIWTSTSILILAQENDSFVFWNSETVATFL